MIIMPGIDNNPLLNYCYTYYSASNPLQDSSDIPADNAFLSNIQDLNQYKNNLAQADTAARIQLQYNIANNKNAFYFDSTVNACAYSPNSPNNNLTGAISCIVIAEPGNLTDSGQFLSNCDATAGFSFGKFGAKSGFTIRGVASYTADDDDWTGDPQVTIFTWDGSNIVQIFTNRILVANMTDIDTFLQASTAPLCFGSFDGTVTSWDGWIFGCGFAPYVWTANQRAQLFDQAMSLIGI